MFHNFKLWLCSWFLTMKELLLSLMAKIYWKTSKMVTLWWLHTVKTFFFSSGARRSFVEALFLHHGKKLCLFLLVFSWIIFNSAFWVKQFLNCSNSFIFYLAKCLLALHFLSSLLHFFAYTGKRKCWNLFFPFISLMTKTH